MEGRGVSVNEQPVQLWANQSETGTLFQHTQHSTLSLLIHCRSIDKRSLKTLMHTERDFEDDRLGWQDVNEVLLTFL